MNSIAEPRCQELWNCRNLKRLYAVIEAFLYRARLGTSRQVNQTGLDLDLYALHATDHLVVDFKECTAAALHCSTICCTDLFHSSPKALTRSSLRSARPCRLLQLNGRLYTAAAARNPALVPAPRRAWGQVALLPRCAHSACRRRRHAWRLPNSSAPPRSTASPRRSQTPRWHRPRGRGPRGAPPTLPLPHT